MKTSVTRRLVLRGAGGFTLGLPVLPSLLSPKGAYGAESLFAAKPRFVAFTTEHGGIAAANMYPDPALLTERTALFPGHEISSGRLVAKTEGSDAVLSPVLRAPSSSLSARLVGKMNVLRGLDIPWGIQHHSGGHLGNYAANAGNGSDGVAMQANPFPTIDQVMGWSPSVYSSLAGIKERVILAGIKGGLSFNYSNPGAKSGPIQNVRPEPDSLALFNKIFVPVMTPIAEQRKPIVDRVLANYRSLRQSNARMSGLDKQRLDDHMDRLAELQRRLNITSPVSCNAVAKPAEGTDALGETSTDPAKAKRRHGLYNDVIAAAFMCGTSRVAVVGIEDTFSSYSGDWHQGVAHHCLDTGQTPLTEALRLGFQGAFLDLMIKLDVEEAQGKTYLDNTLMAWTQESGIETHDGYGIPIVTAGGAAGFLKTGVYADYRNLSNLGKIIEHQKWWGYYTGLTLNRWFATALQAMRIPPSEFERGGARGYAHPFIAPDHVKFFVPGVLSSASEVLPLLKA